jgi:3-hydroxyacyl-CoA dehydrogenase/enoyl-CoA hydratase/3-hydroxybutyryl-CoA epimerase
MEGLSLLNEGVSPALIERLGIKAGMRKGPLSLLDEMSLATTLLFEKRKKEQFGAVYYHKKEIIALDKMVNTLQRHGFISKAGFYDYTNNSPALWSELTTHFPSAAQQPSETEIIERFMFVQVIDAARALEEGVITTVAEANIGSILGWGFSPFKGGVLQYIQDYGVKAFVEKAKILEQIHGSRFALPNTFEKMFA